MKFAWIIAFFLINATVRCDDDFGSGTDTDDSKNMDDKLDEDDELDTDNGNEKEDLKHVDKGKDKENVQHVDNRMDKGHFVTLNYNNLIRNKKALSNIQLLVREDIRKLLKLIVISATESITTQNPVDNCPPGFHFLSKARTCYKVVYEKHNWTSAGQRCRDLNPKAHLAAISTHDENNALKSFLRLELRNTFHERVCGSPHDHQKHFWTSGQRVNGNKCRGPFVWKISADKHLPLQITDWLSREPNCLYGKEHCLHMYMRSRYELGWNDLSCDSPICPLCEYDLE